MVDRLLEQRKALDSYCVQHARHLLFSDDDWKVLEEIHELLMPFTKLNKNLCKETASLAMQLTA